MHFYEFAFFILKACDVTLMPESEVSEDARRNRDVSATRMSFKRKGGILVVVGRGAESI